jgi:L-threonylcarbamoyladenylate synthase
VISALHLQRALAALAAGGVIACPAEAVWGLSCDPFDADAVARLLALKRRPVGKGLILVAADSAQLAFLLHDLPAELRDKMTASWPGPNTWLVPHRGRVPPWIHGEHDSVAVRVSGHRGLRQLCAAWGGPLVSSSANIAGHQAPRARFQVLRYFGDGLDAVLPGVVCRAGRPSTIRDVFTDRVIRA